MDGHEKTRICLAFGVLGLALVGLVVLAFINPLPAVIIGGMVGVGVLAWALTEVGDWLDYTKGQKRRK